MASVRYIRVGGWALIVVGALQVLALAVQAALTLDFAVSMNLPYGHAVVESPWIGYAEAASTLTPLVTVLALLGVVSLIRAYAPPVTVTGIVSLLLIGLGYGAVILGGAAAGLVSWSNLSQCFNPRNCNVFDPHGYLQSAGIASLLGQLIAGVGLVTLAFVMWNAAQQGSHAPRLLLALLGAFTIAPGALILATMNWPGLDGAGLVKINIILALPALVAACLWIAIGRALLSAQPQPGSATPALQTAL